MLVIDDATIRENLDPETAISAVRRALAAHAKGELSAPPRTVSDLGEGRGLVYTAGRLPSIHGVRIYEWHDGEHVLAVWHRDGTLMALAHGRTLGPRRTGAIGAVAVDALALPDADSLGLVGAGPQALNQLWAIRHVRNLKRVTVSGKTEQRAVEFAAIAKAEYGIDVEVTTDAREAVVGHQIVIVATGSDHTIVQSEWVEPGTFISSMGPKFHNHHEVDADVGGDGRLVVTDSIDQYADIPIDQQVLFPVEKMVPLSSVTHGDYGRTSNKQVVVFASVGLAGTEVAVGAALAHKLNEQRGIQPERHQLGGAARPNTNQ